MTSIALWLVRLAILIAAGCLGWFALFQALSVAAHLLLRPCANCIVVPLGLNSPPPSGIVSNDAILLALALSMPLASALASIGMSLLMSRLGPLGLIVPIIGSLERASHFLSMSCMYSARAAAHVGVPATALDEREDAWWLMAALATLLSVPVSALCAMLGMWIRTDRLRCHKGNPEVSG